MSIPTHPDSLKSMQRSLRTISLKISSPTPPQGARLTRGAYTFPTIPLPWGPNRLHVDSLLRTFCSDLIIFLHRIFCSAQIHADCRRSAICCARAASLDPRLCTTIFFDRKNWSLYVQNKLALWSGGNREFFRMCHLA